MRSFDEATDGKSSRGPNGPDSDRHHTSTRPGLPPSLQTRPPRRTGERGESVLMRRRSLFVIGLVLFVIVVTSLSVYFHIHKETLVSISLARGAGDCLTGNGQWKLRQGRYRLRQMVIFEQGGGGVASYAGGTGWLALEPTCVPWHERCDCDTFLPNKPLPAAPPR